MDVLLTFTGFHDPYFKGLIDQEEQPGPILSLLAARSFDHIFLFDTPSTQRVTRETKDAILKLHKKSTVHVLEISLDDPTDYQEIFRGVRTHAKTIMDQFSSAGFFVAVASGTPQMHACWVLLTASGEIPARILHVRPPHFVTEDRPLVSEVDLSSREFPTVRFQAGMIFVEENGGDVDSARIQLGIVGDHPAMQRTLETGAMLSPSHAPILIFGETGTGKELFARFIHRNDLPDLLRQWAIYKNFKFAKAPGVEAGTLLPSSSEKPRCWWATIQSVAENEYNLAAGRYKPQVAEKPSEEDPAELIRATLAIEQEIVDGLENLLKEVETAE